MTGPDDTVYAPATAPGRAAVAIVRVSGPGAGRALRALSAAPPPAPRTAALRSLADPESGAPIDRALLLWFPAPHSFTGEDVVEFHLHGGRAVVDALLAALDRVPGCRPAEPGEFTRRAFFNGRLDLTEAEAIADLVDAETEAQRRQALRQMAGALGALCDGWRDRLVRTLAHVEAEIDFPDEELPEGLIGRAVPEIAALAAEIRTLLAEGRRGERVREGVSVAIVGAPNAGKSSLLNALARRDVAIVSDIAGTTRDVIEIRLDLGGHLVTVADTAGLRRQEETRGDPVEAEGVRRALARAEAADIRVALFDASGPPDATTLALVEATEPGRKSTLAAANKMDLPDARLPVPPGGTPCLPLSVRTGVGLEALLAALSDRVAALAGGEELPALTRARHRRALEEAADSLERAAAATAPELLAEDLRLAMRALGRITGRVDVEDLLDVVFRDFCIGK